MPVTTQHSATVQLDAASERDAGSLDLGYNPAPVTAPACAPALTLPRFESLNTLHDPLGANAPLAIMPDRRSLIATLKALAYAGALRETDIVNALSEQAPIRVWQLAEAGQNTLMGSLRQRQSNRHIIAGAREVIEQKVKMATRTALAIHRDSDSTQAQLKAKEALEHAKQAYQGESTGFPALLQSSEALVHDLQQINRQVNDWCARNGVCELARQATDEAPWGFAAHDGAMVAFFSESNRPNDIAASIGFGGIHVVEIGDALEAQVSEAYWETFRGALWLIHEYLLPFTTPEDFEDEMSMWLEDSLMMEGTDDHQTEALIEKIADLYNGRDVKETDIDPRTVLADAESNIEVRHQLAKAAGITDLDDISKLAECFYPLNQLYQIGLACRFTLDNSVRDAATLSARIEQLCAPSNEREQGVLDWLKRVAGMIAQQTDNVALMTLLATHLPSQDIDNCQCALIANCARLTLCPAEHIEDDDSPIYQMLSMHHEMLMQGGDEESESLNLPWLSDVTLARALSARLTLGMHLIHETVYL